MAKTILLVEDNDFIRNMYQLKLSKSGFTVVEASDGAMALEKLKTLKPDLILLDLMMPNVSGIEVLKNLHKQTIVPALPVIVLTNVLNPASVNEAKELGARDYIIKTDLTPSQVVEKIKAVLSGNNS